MGKILLIEKLKWVVFNHTGDTNIESSTEARGSLSLKKLRDEKLKNKRYIMLMLDIPYIIKI